MPKYYYDLYINDQWSGQYSRKSDAVSDAKDIFEEDETISYVEVVKCDSYDYRDGGNTVYEKHRK